MKDSTLLDILVSNLIILTSYLSILILYDVIFLNEKYLMYTYFPFGILVLSFLFFGNKIMFSLIIGQIINYILLKNYNVYLYLDDYFITSIIYVTCVPITLLILNKLKFNVGMGHSFILDKSNIYHVILITLFSSATSYFLTLFISLFYELNFSVNFYGIGNFIGGSLLILTLKLMVNFKNYLKI